MLEVLIGIGVVAALLAAGSIRVIKQYERGLVFRLGRVVSAPLEPGLTFIIPLVDQMRKVNMQIVTMPVPGQDGITRDNVTVRVDAVLYFNVVDPRRAIVNVEDYRFAMGQVAQTSLRSIIGKSDLDDLLANRERLNEGLELMIDSPAVSWGVNIDRVEIKDVALPESMKRSMSHQAEAERDRRARIIAAEGELQASERLSQAAARMERNPSALQLRLLQTVVDVAAEKNSTLVLPFPVELLRFLESSTVANTTREQAAGEQDAHESADSEVGSRTAERAPDAEAEAATRDRVTERSATEEPATNEPEAVKPTERQVARDDSAAPGRRSAGDDVPDETSVR